MTFNIQSVLTGFVHRRDPGDNATETRNTVQWTDYGGTGSRLVSSRSRARGGDMNNLEIEQCDKFFSQKTTWTKKCRVCFLVVKYLERMKCFPIYLYLFIWFSLYWPWPLALFKVVRVMKGMSKQFCEYSLGIQKKICQYSFYDK